MSGLDAKGSAFPNGINVPAGKLHIADVAVTATAAELNKMDGVTASAAEINRACDVSTRVVNCTAAALALTLADHDGKIVTLNKADGIAVTLPAATGSGAHFRLIVGTTFTANGTIKVASAADVLVGHAILLQDSADTIVGFETAAASDTITFYTAANNTTGGVAGATVELIDIAAGKWWVRYISAAGGTEVTPFSATVS